MRAGRSKEGPRTRRRSAFSRFCRLAKGVPSASGSALHSTPPPSHIHRLRLHPMTFNALAPQPRHAPLPLSLPPPPFLSFLRFTPACSHIHPFSKTSPQPSHLHLNTSTLSSWIFTLAFLFLFSPLFYLFFFFGTSKGRAAEAWNPVWPAPHRQ